jgi:hypothetical protein
MPLALFNRFFHRKYRKSLQMFRSAYDPEARRHATPLPSPVQGVLSTDLVPELTGKRTRAGLPPSMQRANEPRVMKMLTGYSPYQDVQVARLDESWRKPNSDEVVQAKQLAMSRPLPLETTLVPSAATELTDHRHRHHPPRKRADAMRKPYLHPTRMEAMHLQRRRGSSAHLKVAEQVTLYAVITETQFQPPILRHRRAAVANLRAVSANHCGRAAGQRLRLSDCAPSATEVHAYMSRALPKTPPMADRSSTVRLVGR